MAPVITVSATYGAGGSVIAPRLAADLGLPFIDRLISADASQAAVARSQEGLVEGEQEATPVGRFLSYFARAAHVGTVLGPEADLVDDQAIRERTEEPLRKVATGAPAVILGRAAAIVLRQRPRAYHVRLTGPVERRLEWASAFEHLDRDSAARRQSETDRARTAFVKRLYRIDPADVSLYHLVVDPTVLGLDSTITVIQAAARAFFGDSLDGYTAGGPPAPAAP
jgi:cytidylate kinase